MYKQSVGRLHQWGRLAALLSLLIGASAANAALYSGRWDPVFNTSFSGAVGQSVGWMGTTTVTVDDACLLAPPGTLSVPSACPLATLDGTTLIFYNTISNATIGGIAWAGLLPSIDQVHIDAYSNLDGIDLAGPLTALTTSFGPQYNVALDFTLSGPSLTLTGACANSSYLLAAVSSQQPCIYNSQVTPPTITWTRVPEPAPLALIGIALAALGVSRRRVQRRSEA